MDRQTYGNAQVADYLTENFVLAKVNGESSAEVHWKGKVMTERAFARSVGVSQVEFAGCACATKASVRIRQRL